MATEKYSVGEYERRFLLGELPAGLQSRRQITDHYLDRSRLRARSVEYSTGEAGEKKLGHKRRVDDDDPTAIMCTSLYLDDEEFALVSSLPGRPLLKTRWSLQLGDRVVSIDEFGGRLAGLILLEINFADREELQRFRPPSWFGPDVTLIGALTGGELAGRRIEDIEALLTAIWNR